MCCACLNIYAIYCMQYIVIFCKYICARVVIVIYHISVIYIYILYVCVFFAITHLIIC